MDFCTLAPLQQALDFPQEAQAALAQGATAIQQAGLSDAFDAALSHFVRNGHNIRSTEPLLAKITEKSGVHSYTLHLLLLLACAQAVREHYKAAGLSDALFLDTFSDLRAKVLECHEVYNVWGNFVAFWYPIFFKLDIFKLGRLEFENSTYGLEAPYEGHGITLKKGAPIKSIHIPSHCGPLRLSDRLDAYKRAYDFFGCAKSNTPLVCYCESWLLHPSTMSVLPATSNTVDFIGDFDLCKFEDIPTFHDKWRIFGADFEKPDAQLPETTSMQRAFKQHLLRGGKTGYGYGILIFDGTKLLTRS